MKGDSTLLCGGFGLSGVPDTLINQVEKMSHIKGLTAVSNNAGIPGAGLGKLLASKQVNKMIASYGTLANRRYTTGAVADHAAHSRREQGVRIDVPEVSWHLKRDPG